MVSCSTAVTISLVKQGIASEDLSLQLLKSLQLQFIVQLVVLLQYIVNSVRLLIAISRKSLTILVFIRDLVISPDFNLRLGFSYGHSKLQAATC